MEKNNFMVFGLYQQWFRSLNNDFREKPFLGRYGSVVPQQHWEDMMQEVFVFYLFLETFH